MNVYFCQLLDWTQNWHTGRELCILKQYLDTKDADADMLIRLKSWQVLEKAMHADKNEHTSTNGRHYSYVRFLPHQPTVGQSADRKSPLPASMRK
jgi:hypothetical protein